jgi:rod shape determining protein RodA
MLKLKDMEEKFAELDYVTLGIVLSLTVFGLISIYSASSFASESGWSFQFIIQFISLFLGIGFLTVIYFTPKQFLLDKAWLFYVFGVMLLILPFFLSSDSAETNRWIDLGFVKLQPSEFMKFFLIIILARYFSITRNSTDSFVYVIKPFFLTLIPFSMVFIQPDLGTSLVYIAVFIGMLFASGIRIYYIFLLVAPLITIVAAFHLTAFTIWGIFLGIIVFYNQTNLFSSVGVFIGNIAAGLITPLVWNHLKPYQQTRILTMFNADLDPLGAGYQVLQSQIAIGSGGLKGKGFLAGTQTHLRFLPEQHTDFIFSVIAEEFGFIMVAILFILFFILFIRWFAMAFKARDKFGAMLVIGGTVALLFHFFINIGMTVGLLPVTGKPLPFLSYGGSFLVTCFGLVGIILNGNSEQIPRVPTFR